PGLSSNIDLQGPGASSLTVRRDTGGSYSIFTVDSGATVALSGLTITNAYGFGLGGGINNSRGTLTLNNATVSGNYATCDGGHFNDGTLTLNNAIVSGNEAYGSGYDGGYGGGIFNSGTLTLNNATVSGNYATGYYDYDYGVYVDGFGGGIYNFYYGTVTLNN